MKSTATDSKITVQKTTALSLALCMHVFYYFVRIFSQYYRKFHGIKYPIILRMHKQSVVGLLFRGGQWRRLDCIVSWYHPVSDCIGGRENRLVTLGILFLFVRWNVGRVMLTQECKIAFRSTRVLPYSAKFSRGSLFSWVSNPTQKLSPRKWFFN